MVRMFQFLATAGVVILAVGAATADDKAAKKAAKQLSPEARFQKMDANSDGKVSKEEYTRLQEAWLARLKEKGKEAPKGSIDRRFDRLDANRDGSVTKDEFVQSIKKRQEKVKKKTDDK